ncbi:hypothetical protein GPECTOR_61g808 [Gonium pectorale]|uniref:Amidohydrolase 3 domain-containing protein n=1 Tax=Gonium pectorale TaxID=33097 RepID=A0A150G5P3_GONPE|nr:hypothetical protein GPECTOR_61g808 [Gonium pectorale]|eukprot:KXZ44855.1 hypothetical protein GPECTOR_61g808 [Gonium pectorale]
MARRDSCIKASGSRLRAEAPGHHADSRFHLFHNATFWTADDSVPFASALLVRGGLVAAVGSREDVGRRLAQLTQRPEGRGPNATAEAHTTASSAAEVVLHDLGGAFMVPGFVDPHIHIIPGGLGLSRVDLRGTASRADFAARLAAGAAALGPDEEWLLGGLWDEGEWGDGLPSREWLDEVGREPGAGGGT